MNDELATDRIDRCRQAIRDVYGTSSDEFGAALFVNHHLEELSENYWLAEFGSCAPSPETIIDGLVAKYRSGGSGYSVAFTLPENATNYVVCVEVDDRNGASVSMER